MKIVFTDADTVSVGDLSFSAFADHGTVIRYGVTAPEEVIERVADADIVLCNKTLMTAEVLQSAKELKYIGILATGCNNVDLDEAKKQGITVTNVPGYSTEGVVQLVFTYLTELFGNLVKYRASVDAGDWKTSPTFSYFPYPIQEMAGKTIGVVGFGTVGSRVAKVADAFGMKVLVNTRTPKSGYPYEFVDFDILLRESDVVTLHCPLTPQTKGLMNAEAFGRMKKGAVLINTSRGPVIDEQALREALDCGKLMGAGLDVLCTEPMTDDCPLFGAPNCIITPHIAWAAAGTRARLLGIAEHNLAAFLAGTPENVVNE